DHPLLRRAVAALDPLRELDLLRRGEQRVAAGLVQEQLQRVGGQRGLGGEVQLEIVIVLVLGERLVDLVQDVRRGVVLLGRARGTPAPPVEQQLLGGLVLVQGHRVFSHVLLYSSVHGRAVFSLPQRCSPFTWLNAPEGPIFRSQGVSLRR